MPGHQPYIDTSFEHYITVQTGCAWTSTVHRYNISKLYYSTSRPCQDINRTYIQHRNTTLQYKQTVPGHQLYIDIQHFNITLPYIDTSFEYYITVQTGCAGTSTVHRYNISILHYSTSRLCRDINCTYIQHRNTTLQYKQTVQ